VYNVDGYLSVHLLYGLFYFIFLGGWMDEEQPGVIFKKHTHTGGRNVIGIILLLGFLCCQIIEHYY